MLCDRHTGGCCYDPRGSGYVEGSARITTGSARIYGICPAGIDAGGDLTHGKRTSGDLLNGLAFHPQSGQKGRYLGIGGLTGHNLHHGSPALLKRQIFALKQVLDALLHG
jgi:hypothetical protein